MTDISQKVVADALMDDETPTKPFVPFPPRPKAIVTLLHSLDFLPGTQTLLYSLQKSSLDNSHDQGYPPEIVVLVTPNVSNRGNSSIYQDLCPTLCTRILPIEEWDPPSDLPTENEDDVKKPWERRLDNHCPGWAKLQMFGLQQYQRILYIDSDCLVLRDISKLLEDEKIDMESSALTAAVPDVSPSHHFNSGVMVIRPSTKVMADMKCRAEEIVSSIHDRSDTGFLNAYFNGWDTEFPPTARLPIGYNAQQSLYDTTADTDGKSKYWDTEVAPGLHIVHFSNSIKPWQVEVEGSSLQSLWKTWYTKSKNFLLRQKKQKALRTANEQAAAAAKQAAMPRMNKSTGPDSRQLHKLITKRFKELKKEGKSAKEAMQQATKEYGQGDRDAQIDPSSAVAAMFGVGGLGQC